MLLIVSFKLYSQSCPSCPPTFICSACSGELVSLTLRFNESYPRLIVASDGKEDLLNRVVNPGEEFTISGGGNSNKKFKDGQVTILVSSIFNTQIITDCSSPVYVNSVFGSFSVVSGKSKNGANICCLSTYTDTTPPVFLSCPDTIKVSLGATSCSTTVNWTTPTIIDNCDNSPTLLPPSRLPGSTFTKGTTLVTYTAKDNLGNVSTCSFPVIVKDVTKPVITGCPSSDIILFANASCEAVGNWTPPSVFDYCGSVSSINNISPGATFKKGTTPVIYTAVDGSDNTSTCTFNVIVKDDIKPIITGCPPKVILPANGACQGVGNWTLPQATDNCDALILLKSVNKPGDLFPLGTTEITYSGTDNSNNSASCKFNVVVEDKLGPVFNNCVSDITVVADDNCKRVVNWAAPSANDNCGATTLISSHKPGDVFVIGITEVKYTATDINGNASYCKFNVIVKNNQLPVFANCPEDKIAKTNASGQAVVDWVIPTASSPCGNVSVTGSNRPGEIFPVGTTDVKYIATDDAGFTATCSFKINVSYEQVEFTIPKALTPDGDGINDQWTISNIEKFEDNNVVIVDRWGSVVYKATGYNNQNVVWDGVNKNGGLVPTGTYFYTISVRFGQAHVEKRGFIELVR